MTDSQSTCQCAEKEPRYPALTLADIDALLKLMERLHAIEDERLAR